MSAFTLESDHIDLLITLAMKIPDFNPEYTDIPKTADLLGQDLLNENYRSVNYRYDEQTEVPEYHWTPVELPEELTPQHLLQILNAVHCYNYQTCEHPEWKDSKAFWVMTAIESWIETKLTEAKYPKRPDPHYKDRPPYFHVPTYMVWEWNRQYGFDFEAMKELRS